MPSIIHVRPDDEIADVIDRVRGAQDDVALVVPRGSTALQTPLNARLLSQFAKQHGHRTAVVSEEPRVQELARQHGFPVYTSVPAYERGLEVGAAGRTAPGGPYRSAAAAGLAGAAVLDEAPANAVAAPPAAPVAAAGAGAAVPRRRLAVPPRTQQPPPPGGRHTRRPLYFAAAAIAIVGLLLFFLLAPSAKITITVAGTPLSINPTIQGTADPTAAHQGDHIPTAVVSATASGSFSASPTGSETLPATQSSGNLVFSTNVNQPIHFTLQQGNTFQTSDGSQTFLVTQQTVICIGPSSDPATSGYCGQQPNASAPVQAQTAGAAGNVPSGAVTKWSPQSEDPCNGSACSNPFLCNQPSGQCDIFLSNPQAMSGGADQKQVTVASDNDVSNWNAQVTQTENTLTSQLNQQIQGKSGGKTFAVDPGGGGKSITFTVTPQLPSPGTQFSATKISVSGTAAATVYDPADVRNDVLADLQAKVAQGDQLAPGKLNMSPCQVTQAATDGTVILSCSATDFSQPIVDLPGLKSQLAGKSPGSAEKIIDAAIDKVQNVDVSEFPFKLFYLPLFSSRIEIDENFVSQPSAGT